MLIELHFPHYKNISHFIYFNTQGNVFYINENFILIFKNSFSCTKTSCEIAEVIFIFYIKTVSMNPM